MKLDALLADADAVDDELATAINVADGDALIPVLSRQAAGCQRGQRRTDRDAFTAVFGRR